MPELPARAEPAASPPAPRDQAQPAPAEAGPEPALAAFAAAIESRRLDEAVAQLAEDARFVTPDGTVVSGALQLRGMIRQVLAMPSSISIAPERAIELGQTAIATQVWAMRFQGGDGVPLDRTSTATLALRRSRAGWRISLVAPWGLTGAR